MGAEITAGLPASLTAIGVYTGIISAVGMACCSLVSICERRLRAEGHPASSGEKNTPAPRGQLRRVEPDRLRRDFLSPN